ncbi:MAG: hypothetical protein WCJ55_16600 [Chloroflexales bacterium]
MTTVQDVLTIATQLTPVEQLEVIQALSRALQQRYTATAAPPEVTPGNPRIAGLDQGTYWVSDDFDAELPDEFWLGGDDERAA